MRSNNVKKLVYSSSATVYGTPKSLPITEDHPTGQVSRLIVEDIKRCQLTFNCDLSFAGSDESVWQKQIHGWRNNERCMSKWRELVPSLIEVFQPRWRTFLRSYWRRPKGNSYWWNVKYGFIEEYATGNFFFLYRVYQII